MSEWHSISAGDGEGSPVHKGKLEEIDVRRVDAVGSPAHGHRFVVIKSEPDPARQEALEHELVRRRSLQVGRGYGIATAEQRKERSKSLSTEVGHELMTLKSRRGDDVRDENVGFFATDRFGHTKRYGGSTI
jgi:hypothetical protein